MDTTEEAGFGHSGAVCADVSPPVVTPALTKLCDELAAGGDASPAAAAARGLLEVLQLRTYPPSPHPDDLGEQVVITVYGVDVSVRRRADGVFVHVDSTDMPTDLGPLIGEFNCAGEYVYGPDRDHD